MQLASRRLEGVLSFILAPLDGRCMRRYDERECHARRNRGGARMTTDEECWPFFFFFFF